MTHRTKPSVPVDTLADVGSAFSQQVDIETIHQDALTPHPADVFDCRPSCSSDGIGELSHVSTQAEFPKNLLLSAHSMSTVVLATIIVPLVGSNVFQHNARALPDTGSSASFITEAMVRKLG